MMYGLPASSEMRKQLSKEAIIKRFEVSGRERERFDKSVHKIVITHNLCPSTINIPIGKQIQAIYVIEIYLREPGFDRIAIAILERMNQSAIYILKSEGKCKVVMFEKKLFESDWVEEEDLQLVASGLDLDEVWESFLRNVSGLNDNAPLQDLIDKEVSNDKIKRQIETLRNKMAKEKQVHKRREYFDMIIELEAQLK